MGGGDQRHTSRTLDSRQLREVFRWGGSLLVVHAVVVNLRVARPRDTVGLGPCPGCGICRPRLTVQVLSAKRHVIDAQLRKTAQACLPPSLT